MCLLADFAPFQSVAGKVCPPSHVGSVTYSWNNQFITMNTHPSPSWDDCGWLGNTATTAVRMIQKMPLKTLPRMRGHRRPIRSMNTAVQNWATIASTLLTAWYCRDSVVPMLSEA